MLHVSIANEQSALRVRSAEVRQLVRAILVAEDIESAGVRVAFVGDAAMQALNRRHLAHDYPTDVLSFAEETKAAGGGREIEADIVVSTETATAQAARFGWDAWSETLLYIVHGALHACGYDDSTPARRSVMRRREREVLKNWGLTPHYGRARSVPGDRGRNSTAGAK